jgi:hypothetical protein
MKDDFQYVSPMATHRLGNSAGVNKAHRYLRNLGYAANRCNYTLGAGFERAFPLAPKCRYTIVQLSRVAMPHKVGVHEQGLPKSTSLKPFKDAK